MFVLLDPRKAQVLKALVECYIRTGEAVSSRTILEFTDLGVSSATIRHDLAALESDGFVVQPHTSAGRVPTATAYRYYVDQLSPKKLRRESVSRIHEFFGNVHHELSQLLRETTEMLAEVSRYPAMVLGPGLRGEKLQGVHIIPMGSKSALVILVTNAGRVSQELVRFESSVSQGDLDRAEQVLADRLKGMAVSDLGDVDEELFATVEPVVSQVLRSLFSVAPSQEESQELYVGGTNQMAALWDDLAKVQQVLELMSREARLLGILAASPEGTSIRIGTELDLPPDVDVAVISTDYAGAEGLRGKVGVIGPMRMDYNRTISIVEEVGEGLSEQLGSQP